MTTPFHTEEDMDPNELLKLLNLNAKPTRPPDATSPIAPAGFTPHDAPGSTNPTALEVDEWGLRRGRDLVAESERLRASGTDEFAAAGLDVDEYASGTDTPGYHCPHCQAVLDRVTPLIAFGPGWHWQLNHNWLAERLNKARLYDREHPDPV